MNDPKNYSILLADDDAAIRLVLSETFADEGWQVIEAHDIPSMRALVAAGKGDVLLTDVLMPGGNGLDMIAEVKELRPQMPIIVMSAQNSLSTAVRASNEGAFDYLPKPFDLDEMISVVSKALKQTVRVVRDKEAPAAKETGVELIGRSPVMQDLYRTIARVVPTNLTVLIHGESGTGKELVAQALHQHGTRKDKPFVAVNMAAIPRELIESELFGHERGAFTGAASSEKGRFGQAKGGTLFLDEIGDMPFEAQTRLLRVLQEGEYHAVGGRTLLRADVRIIAATHQDLPALVKEKRFRQDLYYRLNVVPLVVPPLRNRLEDISDLASHFLQLANQEGFGAKELDAGAVEALLAYTWPGNVREMENLLRRIAALYSEHRITAAIVKAELSRNMSEETQLQTSGAGMGDNIQAAMQHHLERYFNAHGDKLPPNGLYHRVLREIERPLIEKVMRATNANQLRAAEILGLNRNTLRKKIRELGISVSRSNGKDDK